MLFCVFQNDKQRATVHGLKKKTIRLGEYPYPSAKTKWWFRKKEASIGHQVEMWEMY